MGEVEYMKHLAKTVQNALLGGFMTAVLAAPVYARNDQGNTSTGIIAPEAMVFKERPARMGPNGIRSSGLHLAESPDKKTSAPAQVPWERSISSYAPRSMQTINQDSVPKLGRTISDSAASFVRAKPVHLFHTLPVEFEGTTLEAYHSFWRGTSSSANSGKQVEAYNEFIFEVELDGNMHWLFGDKELRNAYVFTGRSPSKRVNKRHARTLPGLDPVARRRLHNLHAAIRDAEQKWEPPVVIRNTHSSNHVVRATSFVGRRQR